MCSHNTLIFHWPTIYLNECFKYCLLLWFQVEEKKKEFNHYLSSILSRHAKRRHLREPHFVSNTLPSEDKHEFKSLRKDIFCHAKDLQNWGDTLPTRWIVLEKEINMKLPEHVMSYTDAAKLAIKCSFHDDSQMT